MVMINLSSAGNSRLGGNKVNPVVFCEVLHMFQVLTGSHLCDKSCGSPVSSPAKTLLRRLLSDILINFQRNIGLNPHEAMLSVNV